MSAARVNRQRPTGSSPLARPTLVPQVEVPVVGSPPAVPPQAPAPVVTHSGSPEVREPGNQNAPRYRTFERVDALLRPDQIEDLTELRKRLSRQRTERGERLTNNTMIRLAVDMLIGEAERNGIILGNTEDELRANLDARLLGRERQARAGERVPPQG